MNQISRAPLYKLAPAEEKVIEAIAFIIAEAERRNLNVTQYDIVKALFFADRSHMNMYGRPITFDNYVAMRHGPVPSLAYDMLRGKGANRHYHQTQTLPWQRREAPKIGKGVFVYFAAKSMADEDVLSESDIEALQNALASVKSLTFSQIRRLTHEDPAYIEAWDYDDSDNTPMSLALLFDRFNEEQAQIVQFMSLHRDSKYR